MFPGQLGRNEEGTCAESAWTTEHPGLLVAFFAFTLANGLLLQGPLQAK